MEQKKKIKIIIIVLAVLLGISLAALGGTLIYNKIANATPATVTVPDNLITADEDTTKPASSDSQAPDSSDTEKPDGSYTKTPDSSAAASFSAVPTQSTTAEVKKAAKQNTSVCVFPTTIKSPCITKPPFAPVMRN